MLCDCVTRMWFESRIFWLMQSGWGSGSSRILAAELALFFDCSLGSGSVLVIFNLVADFIIVFRSFSRVDWSFWDWKDLLKWRF